MSSSGSGPAIMMMPPHIRATFMPDPPLMHLPPPSRRRPKLYVEDYKEEEEATTTVAANGNIKQEDSKDTSTSTSSRLAKKGILTGVSSFMNQFETTAPPPRKLQPSSTSTKARQKEERLSKLEATLAQPKSEYQAHQRDSAGEFQGMNCYNTLFIGRLAYEVSERKLLREMEQYGPVKDIQLIKDKEGKSRGYAFCEYENEEDMKRAYRAADGMVLEGKPIVVDVERGHTVPAWLPRRLGGGLGGTRLGGKSQNVTRPGRFDPSKPMVPNGMGMGGNGGGPGGMGGPPPGYDGGPPHHHHGGYGGPPHGYGGGRGRGPPPRGGYNGGGYGGPPQGGGYGGGGGYGRGGGYNDRGPPRGGGYRGGGGGRFGGGPPRGGDRGMKRGRDRSPDQNRGGRRRYERDY